MDNVGSDKRIVFDPFSLDLANECLWRGAHVIRLRPKAFAVIGEAYLPVLEAIERLSREQGQVVDVLRAHAPMWLLQMPSLLSASDRETKSSVVSVPPPRAADSPLGVVGRDEALSRMRSWLEKMLGGERQIVFVTGEAGIGKTALVDTFVRSIASDRSIRIGQGQCLEQYGTW